MCLICSSQRGDSFIRTPRQRAVRNVKAREGAIFEKFGCPGTSRGAPNMYQHCVNTSTYTLSLLQEPRKLLLAV